MKRVEKWSLFLLLYIVATSLLRHSLWLGFNELTVVLSLIENVVILIAFFPAFLFHKLFVTPEKYWFWSIPLFAWNVYAALCLALRIIYLTSLLF